MNLLSSVPRRSPGVAAALPFALVLALAAQLCPAQIPTNGLVAQYMLNGNPLDDGPDHLNGTINGTTMTLVTDHFGRPNSAYLFDGTDNYIDVATNGIFSPANYPNGYSISLWVAPYNLDFSSPSDGYLYYFSKLSSGEDEWAFRMYNDNPAQDDDRPNRLSAYMFNLDGGFGQGCYSQTTLTAQQWIHLVFTIDINGNSGAGILNYYKNGTFVETEPLHGEYTVNPASGTAPVRIGTGDINQSSNLYFNGSIGDVCFYNRVLSQAEITQLYNDTYVPAPAMSAPTSISSATISTTLSGATIRYTTDGSTPTEASGTLYTAPVAVSSGTVLNAIAYESGYVDSTVTSAGYTTAVPAGAWQDTAMASQTGTFTVTFDAASASNDNDAVAGLSSGAQTAFTAYSCLVRFNNTGYLDAYNEGIGGYHAVTSVPYTANSIYHFRLVVDVATQTYSIYVTPPGGSEETLGTGYTFRTSVSSLDHWGVFVDSIDGNGDLAVANFVLQ